MLRWRSLLLGTGAVFIGVLVLWWLRPDFRPKQLRENLPIVTSEVMEESLGVPPHELSIAALEATEIPGSEITEVRTLSPHATYTQSVVSYESQGNTIFALLTVPSGTPPASGWPIIVFNHGYIPPDEYRTTEKYVAYLDAFARSGYVVIKPDYRGHGDSEGEAAGGYGSNAYTIDVLNAVASIQKYPGVDPNRLGMWGHSMGGFITLRAMVVNPEIKAGVIWGGVVASHEDLLLNWRRGTGQPSTPPPGVATAARRWRDALVSEYGTPTDNPEFWASLSANSYLQNLQGRPIVLHHGTADASVPIEFSQQLVEQLTAAGQTGELFTYQGDDHNLSGSLRLALQRSVEFFDQQVKQGTMNKTEDR